MTSPRLPNLLIAGVTKAGTTSLFAYLAQHPSICGMDGKGAGYFSALRYGDTPLAPLREYESHFQHCGIQPYRLEATLSYCQGGPRVIEAIEALLDDPRVIISLRNPVDRLWSSYKMKKAKRQLPRSETFEGFIDYCQELYDREEDRLPENELYQTLRTGMYSEYIPLWVESFGDDLRIVFSEHLAKDPIAVLTALCDWLGIDAATVGSFDYTIRNRSVLHRSARLRVAAKALNRASWRLFRRNPKLYGLVRRTYEKVNGESFNEKLSTETRSRLEQFYSRSNESLASTLRDFGYSSLPLWLGGSPESWSGADPEELRLAGE